MSAHAAPGRPVDPLVELFAIAVLLLVDALSAVGRWVDDHADLVLPPVLAVGLLMTLMLVMGAS